MKAVHFEINWRVESYLKFVKCRTLMTNHQRLVINRQKPKISQKSGQNADVHGIQKQRQGEVYTYE